MTLMCNVSVCRTIRALRWNNTNISMWSCECVMKFRIFFLRGRGTGLHSWQVMNSFMVIMIILVLDRGDADLTFDTVGGEEGNVASFQWVVMGTVRWPGLGLWFTGQGWVVHLEREEEKHLVCVRRETQRGRFRNLMLYLVYLVYLCL